MLHLPEINASLYFGIVILGEGANMAGLTVYQMQVDLHLVTLFAIISAYGTSKLLD